MPSSSQLYLLKSPTLPHFFTLLVLSSLWVSYFLFHRIWCIWHTFFPSGRLRDLFMTPKLADPQVRSQPHHQPHWPMDLVMNPTPASDPAALSTQYWAAGRAKLGFLYTPILLTTLVWSCCLSCFNWLVEMLTSNHVAHTSFCPASTDSCTLSMLSYLACITKKTLCNHDPEY